MPTYAYNCMRCQNDFEKVLRITESSEPQPCPSCGDPIEKAVTNTSFVLKGDSWAGKAIKVKGQMARKNQRLGAKMKERPSPVKLAPNVGGERTESWADAQKLARDQGKNTSSFNHLVAKEKKGS